MSGRQKIRDYIRDAAGTGINGASYTVKKLVDDTTLASGSTASDTDPNTTILGMLDEDETTIGYAGPIKYTATDSLTGAVRSHTSKSIGIVGSWSTLDVPRMWRLGGKGVVPGVGSDLEVTTNGTNLVISVAAGEFLAALGEDGLLYAWPAARTVTAGTADATNPRIDTVVLRFYPPGLEQEGRIDLALVAGTPAASPSAPSLTQNLATYWEEALADVRVDAGVTSLATNKVTDRRTYCFLYPSGITAGDIFYVDANGKLARMAKGTSGQFLKQGATIPAWATLAESDVTSLTTDLAAKQPLDTDLTAIAALTSAADKVPYATGAGTWALADFSSAGRALVDDASAAAQRTTLGVVAAGAGDIWVEKAGDTMTGGLTISSTLAVTGAATFDSGLTSGNSDDDVTTIRGHLSTYQGDTPAIIANGAAGSAAVASISGNDIAGTITLTPAGVGITTGTIVTITFAEARAATTYSVILTPGSSAARSLGGVVGRASRSTTQLAIGTATALTSGQSYEWDYLIVDRA